MLSRFKKLARPNEAQITMWVAMGADILLKKYKQLKEAQIHDTENNLIRLAYLEAEKEIPLLLPRQEFEEGSPERTTEKMHASAEIASELRQGFRWQARELMPSDEDIRAIQERDLKKYGHEDGPSFPQLLHHYSDGNTHDDIPSLIAHFSIYHSAQRSDKKVNEALKMTESPKNEEG